jgi:RNA 3'-terminal phosphate cyclase (ATP)
MGERRRGGRPKPTPSPPSARQPPRDAEVVVDGSFGEGGGQILRASVALSALTDKSVTVHSIRAGRPNPGLAAQHVAGACAVELVSSAALANASLGSEWVHLSPRGGERRRWGAGELPLSLDQVSTAGSTALVLQAVLPCLLRFVPSARAGRATARITGGTVAMAAPLSDFVEHVLSPNLRLFGVDLQCSVDAHGFFPRGGGVFRVSCRKATTLPCDADGRVTLLPVTLTKRGAVTGVRGRVVVAGSVTDRVGVAMVVASKTRLRRRLRLELDYEGEVDVTLDRVPPHECLGGSVAALTLWATTGVSDGPDSTVFGASGLVDRKSTPSQVSERAADELCEALASGACVDVHMADQLALFMGMASGKSCVRIAEPSLHTRTVVAVLQQFSVDCTVGPTGDDGTCVLSCEGLGVALEP